MTRTNLATLLIGSIAGAVAGALASALMTDKSFDSPVAAADEDGRVARLEQAKGELERSIAELRKGQELLAARSDRSSVLDASAHATDDGASPPISAPAAAEVDPAVEPALTVESALAMLSDPNADYDERTAVWEKATKAGLLDALVDAMKERAEREPNNPDLRVDLGNAYIQKIFAANPAAAGIWAAKADESFDAALALDPQHWEARFTKAVALTHWPAFTGKPTQAIAEFETLISQQNAGAKQDHHAETYFYLGNMYQDKGLKEKAIETWQKGAALFPDNAALKQQIQDAQKL